jgi:hypothetical protein
MISCSATFQMTLSSLALHCRNWPWPICFNMQNMPENMQENMQNMKNNMQNMTNNMQDMTKNMQNNMQNMAKNMFKYAQYVIWYIVTYCDIFCIFYILQYVQYVQNRPSHIVLHIVLHIGLHTATYYFAYSAYSAYCNMSNMSIIDPCILFDILFYISDIYMQYNMQHNFLICRICRSIWQIICQVLICMPDMYGLHIRHIGHIGHMYRPPTSLMYDVVRTYDVVLAWRTTSYVQHTTSYCVSYVRCRTCDIQDIDVRHRTCDIVYTYDVVRVRMSLCITRTTS